MHYGPTVIFVCLLFTLLHNHHYPDVYEGIELLKHLTGIFCRLYLRFSQFFQSSSMHFMGVVFILFISPILIVRICIIYIIYLIIIKSGVCTSIYDCYYVYGFYDTPRFRNIVAVATLGLQPLKLYYFP